jgi:hypothetical protein
MVLLNIGLYVGRDSKDTLTAHQAIRAIENEGLQVLRWAVRQSASEPTLIAEINRPLTDNEGYWLAVILKQESIAEQTADGEGYLHGPMADEWGPFNPDFFLTFEEVQS